jgi:hypothetical protein
MPTPVYIFLGIGSTVMVLFSYLLRNSYKFVPQGISLIVGTGFIVAARFVEAWVGLGYMILAILFIGIGLLSSIFVFIFIRKD